MPLKIPKYFTAVIAIYFIFILLAPGCALAFDLQVKIPGLNEAMIQPDGTTRPIGEYVKAIYVYATGIVGILATVVMMFGGVIWMTAYGSASRVGEAKAWIGAALTGLLLVMASYMIMWTINPALVNLKTRDIPTAQEMSSNKKNTADPNEMGCCKKKLIEHNKTYYQYYTTLGKECGADNDFFPSHMANPANTGCLAVSCGWYINCLSIDGLRTVHENFCYGKTKKDPLLTACCCKLI